MSRAAEAPSRRSAKKVVKDERIKDDVLPIGFRASEFKLNKGNVLSIEEASTDLREEPKTMCEGLDLWIGRLDSTYTAYPKSAYLKYYGRVVGLDMWNDAVPCNHVLVRIGRQERWGLVDRVSEESGFLK